MKQKFSKNDLEQLKTQLSMKNSPGKREKYLRKRAEKYIGYIQWIPGIRMVAIGNSIAMNNAHLDSDIDLYIVTRENRMWLVRICVTCIFQILGIRKTQKKHKDQFCLSFFSTRKGMDFSTFALEHDIYLYFWIVFLQPILSYNQCYSSFIQTNNSWADISEYKEIIDEHKKRIKYKKNIKKTNFFLWNLLNLICKKAFLGKTLQHKQQLGNPYGIVVNNEILKFHNNDKRKIIWETYKKTSII